MFLEYSLLPDRLLHRPIKRIESYGELKPGIFIFSTATGAAFLLLKFVGTEGEAREYWIVLDKAGLYMRALAINATSSWTRVIE